MKALSRNASILAAGAVLWCLLGQTAADADGAAEIRAIQLSIASAAEGRNLDAIMSHYLAGDMVEPGGVDLPAGARLLIALASARSGR
jgi:hypothetical protein